MLKKIIFVMALILSTTFVSVSAYAAPSFDINKATVKFARGLTNIATCPGEYFYQIPASAKETPDYMTAFFVALARGTGFTLLRLGAGIYDVVTAPFPGKTDYKPIMQPETIWGPVGDFLTT